MKRKRKPRTPRRKACNNCCRAKVRCEKEYNSKVCDTCIEKGIKSSCIIPAIPVIPVIPVSKTTKSCYRNKHCTRVYKHRGHCDIRNYKKKRKIHPQATVEDAKKGEESKKSVNVKSNELEHTWEERKKKLQDLNLSPNKNMWYLCGLFENVTELFSDIADDSCISKWYSHTPPVIKI